MGGGIIQLVLKGKIDLYLTGNPEFSFFKAVPFKIGFIYSFRFCDFYHYFYNIIKCTKWIQKLFYKK